MKRTSVFVRMMLLLTVFAILMGVIYCFGKARKPVKYNKIPGWINEWISQLDSLGADGRISNVGYGPYQWSNSTDPGYKTENGWTVMDDDPNFIIYYRNDGNGLWLDRARMTLKVAQQTAPDLASYMGSYPDPSKCNGRKLPIYLPNTTQDYVNTYCELLGRNDPTASKTSGVTISQVGNHGYKCQGIILNPDDFNENAHPKYTYEYVLRHEMNHFVFQSSIDYSKGIEHNLWEYEGLADFFAYRMGEMTPQIAGRDSIDFIMKYCDPEKNFPDNSTAMAYSSYWAGESFFIFLKDFQGLGGAEKFTRSLYEHDFDDAIRMTYSDSISVKDRWLQCLTENADTLQTAKSSK